jgi:uncharacterized membrane protein
MKYQGGFQAMTTLSVLKFNNPDGAEQALQTLRRLQQQHLVQIIDAAVVDWRQGRKGPRTRQAVNLAATGTLSGSFWGFLFGLLFFMPLVGLALGAAAGAITGALTDYGIDDNFIKQTRDKVKPGTSALFLMTAEAITDKVIPELKHLKPELVTTNLSTDQETRLRELFGGGEEAKAEGQATA